jgi:hypothetical protein
MITDSMEPQPHARARAVLIVAATVATILVALLVLDDRIAPENAAPDFGGQRVDTQVLVTGAEVDLELPAATDANGALIYSLYPSVPGLTLTDTRLRGIPEEPGTYSLVYTVIDSDDDTTGADKDWLTFTILVESPRSEWTLEELGDDVDAIDDGGTALCKAARYAGHAEVRMLLELGADPNLYPADRHDTHPISCALASEKPLTQIRRVMQVLADGGAVVPEDGVFVVRAASLDHEDVFSLLRPFFEGRR